MVCDRILNAHCCQTLMSSQTECSVFFLRSPAVSYQLKPILWSMLSFVFQAHRVASLDIYICILFLSIFIHLHLFFIYYYNCFVAFHFIPQSV